MKTITLELNRKKLTEQYENAIVIELKNKFNVIDDTVEKFKKLRFVTISGEDINIDLNGIVIELRNVFKPHIFFAINSIFVYGVEVEFES